MRVLRVSTLLLVGLSFCIDLRSQTTADEAPSALVVLQAQARSIMSELLPKLERAPGRAFTVIVEQASFPRVVENAALQALQDKDIPVLPEGDSTTVLRLLLFDQSVHFSPLPGGMFGRTVHTRLEAREEDRRGGGWKYLGEFERSATDTTRGPEHPPSAVATARDSSYSPNTWERVVTPFVVLGAAVLIVYLFFTVRS